MAPTTAPISAVEDPKWRVNLLGCCQLARTDVPVALGTNARRLIALLALKGRRDRAYVAGTLWPECSEAHAYGNLRQTLSRLHRAGHAEVIDGGAGTLALAPNVSVDVHEVTATAAAVLADRPYAWRTALARLTGDDLLPGWYDDWVLAHRERIRQLRLHGLEALAAQLLESGLIAASLEASLAAVEVEPLRESAHRLVMQAHLAEGNRVEALRQYAYLRELLRAELGTAPSPLVEALLGSD